MKMPGWNAKVTLDQIVKDYQTFGIPEPLPTSTRIIPHLRIGLGLGGRNIDTFCYIGCREAGLSSWICANWCEERQVIHVGI